MARRPSLVSRFTAAVLGLVLVLVSNLMIRNTVSFRHPLYTTHNQQDEFAAARHLARQQTNATFKLWSSVDALSMDVKTWATYLESSTMERSHSYRAGTVDHEDCGYSLRLKYRHPATSTWQLVFFKYASTIYADYFVETHLREIKASHLDRILGTNLTPPVIGKRVPYQKIHDNFVNVGGDPSQTPEQLYKATRCSIVSAENRSVIPAAAMFNMVGVTASRPFDSAQRAAQQFNTTPTTATRSAFLYSLFNYLAACWKTSHNHFWMDRARFIAIDNDRCFQPQSFLQEMSKDNWNAIVIWETVVFGTCTFPESIVAVLFSTERRNNTLSARLIRSLRRDDLAAELLAEDPEVMEEMDGRASRLLAHIRTCQEQDRLRLVP